MSHEKTITIEVDGKHYNIPTVVGGKTLSSKQAADFAFKNKKLGKGFNSLDEAVKAAISRSRSFDKHPTMSLGGVKTKPVASPKKRGIK